VTGTGAGAVPVFIVDTEAVPPRVYLNADIVAPGSITAAMISAGAIEAISLAVRIVDAEQIDAGLITAREIDSNYAIFNRFTGLSSPLSVPVSVTGSGSGTAGPSNSASGNVFASTYSSVAQGVLIWASLQFAGGTDPGYVPTPGLTCSVKLQVLNQAGTVVNEVTMVSVSGSAARPVALNGQSFSANVLAEVPTGETVTIRFRYSLFVGGVGGLPIEQTWTWRWTQANILFLEPRGI
jgi:hypothetical protein